MKNDSLFSLIVTFLFLMSQNGFSQGTINRVNKSNGYKISVKGSASKDLWLGCTVNPDTYNETNLTPIRISKGNFTVQFDLYKGMASNLRQANNTIPFVVALWEERINLRECEKKYGKGSDNCKWAKREGYQLEGRVFRKTGEIEISF